MGIKKCVGSNPTYWLELVDQDSENSDVSGGGFPFLPLKGLEVGWLLFGVAVLLFLSQVGSTPTQSLDCF